MSRSHLCAMLVVVAFFFPVSASAASAIVGPPIVEPPEEVTFPSDEFPTIQSAIDEVADGGTITLRPGRYTESITVTDKSVHFVGSIEPALAKGHKKRQNPSAKLRRDMRSFLKRLPKGMQFLGKTDWEPRSTEIIGADPERAVITFGPGGGGSIKGMTLRGGAFGIQGKKADDGTPLAQLLIAHTHIVATGQGIFGSFSSIKVRDTMIAHTDWNGICILEAETVEVLNTLVADTEAAGLLVFNVVYTGKIRIADSFFNYNEQGGIVIVGAANPVEITHCGCYENGLAGILLVDVGSVQVKHSVVMDTYGVDTPNYSGVGDGLIAVSREDTLPGDVVVKDCRFWFNFRAGLLFENCGGEMQSVRSFFNNYGLVLQGDPKPDWSDPNNIISGNAGNDVVTDGVLGVPDEPMAVPVAPDPS